MWAEACAMIERVERMHRQFFQPSLSAASEIAWEPPVDTFESDRKVRIIAPPFPVSKRRTLTSISTLTIW
jgi:hypothetical protein